MNSFWQKRASRPRKNAGCVWRTGKSLFGTVQSNLLHRFAEDAPSNLLQFLINRNNGTGRNQLLDKPVILGGMGSRVSLANKCLAIFGTANVIIITSLLGVLWMSSSSVLQDYQLEVARQLAYVWINSEVKAEVFD